MGRKVLTGISILVAIILFAFIALAVTSQYSTPDVGVVDGKLKACPGNPNCVCSEAYAGADEGHQIPPIKVNSNDLETPWELLRQAIVDQGGSIIKEEKGYLHAEFTSPIFRFVDDLEMRADRQDGVVHLRSASRVGRSDFGANRKRVEAIWKRFGEQH